MKFKDKDGNVFEDIEAARKNFCKKPPYCGLCAVSKINNGYDTPCEYFVLDNLAEAARLMGYEVVVEEEKVNMDEPLNEREICRLAMDTYGPEAQTLMVMEEMAELQRRDICRDTPVRHGLARSSNGTNHCASTARADVIRSRTGGRPTSTSTDTVPTPKAGRIAPWRRHL